MVFGSLEECVESAVRGEVWRDPAWAGLAGKILVLPESRGSGGTPAGVAEAIRRGTAPLAIVLGKADANIAAGAMIAAELYGREVPVVALTPGDFSRLRTGDRLTLLRRHDSLDTPASLPVLSPGRGGRAE